MSPGCGPSGGELLFGQDSLLLQGGQLLQLGNRIGRCRSPRPLATAPWFAAGATARRQPPSGANHDRGPRHRADQTRTAIPLAAPCGPQARSGQRLGSQGLTRAPRLRAAPVVVRRQALRTTPVRPRPPAAAGAASPGRLPALRFGVHGCDQLPEQAADLQRPVPSPVVDCALGQQVPPAHEVDQGVPQRWPREGPLARGLRGQDQQQLGHHRGAGVCLQRIGLGVPSRPPARPPDQPAGARPDNQQDQ